VALIWPSSPNAPPTQIANSIIAGPQTVSFDIEEGRRIVIRWEKLSAKVFDRTPEDSYGVDDWYLVFNALEALADPVLAMKE
jgi:hypothetical protein